MKDEKIVIVSLGLSLGGTESESSTLANFLCKKGYLVKYIAAYKRERFFILNDGIEFVEPPFTREQHSASFYLLKLIFYLRREINIFSPRQVVSFNEWINPFVIFANLGLDNLIHVRDVMHPKGKYPLLIRVFKKIFYPCAATILVQTSFAKEILSKALLVKHIEIIPTKVNFIDVKTRLAKNRIISIGRLEHVKGHKYLLEAFAKLNSKEWQLHIIGEGSLLNILVKLSSDLKINNRVFFHGKVDDFTDLIAESSIFVLPSIREGFPNVLIEAMSVPLACISGDYYEGREEIIKNGFNGFTFPIGDSDSLANILNTLIHDEELRNFIALNAYRVREKFSPEMVGRKYLEILRNEH